MWEELAFCRALLQIPCSTVKEPNPRPTARCLKTWARNMKSRLLLPANTHSSQHNTPPADQGGFLFPACPAGISAQRAAVWVCWMPWKPCCIRSWVSLSSATLSWPAVLHWLL